MNRQAARDNSAGSGDSLSRSACSACLRAVMSSAVNTTPADISVGSMGEVQEGDIDWFAVYPMPAGFCVRLPVVLKSS